MYKTTSLLQVGLRCAVKYVTMERPRELLFCDVGDEDGLVRAFKRERCYLRTPVSAAEVGQLAVVRLIGGKHECTAYRAAELLQVLPLPGLLPSQHGPGDQWVVRLPG